MNQETLLKFIHRIITVNTDAPSLALNELETILKKQGASPELLQLIETAKKGISESNSTMKKEVSASPALSVHGLQTAVARAHEQKLRDDEAARNGRC